jgi:hypothetical protein
LLKDGNSYKTNVRKDNETEYYTSISDHFDDLSDYPDDDISNISYNYYQMKTTFDSLTSWEDYITSNQYLEIHSVRESNGIRVVEFGPHS